MSDTEKELEVKFFLASPDDLEQRLKRLGATLIQPRIFELNLRFDTPDGSLSKASRVLRLRQDAQAVMTYKGPSQAQEGVSARQEIEFTVGDLVTARHLLEALGYQVNVIYEKYRSTYLIDGVKVTLDEMPFGNFAEIEGPDPAAIHATAEKVHLNWEARSTESYLAIFNRFKNARQLTMRDLTFQAFEGLNAAPAELGIGPGDSQQG